MPLIAAAIPWWIAVLVALCVIVALFIMLAGFALAAILVIGLFGSKEKECLRQRGKSA